jgi:uncharacterized Fe-S cluster protein YjdI
MQGPVEERKQEGVGRSYKNDEIEVFWEPEYCIHSGMCWRNLPDVFRPRTKPWVRPEQAPADEIAWVVSACPSGALSYRRLDGGPSEPVPDTTLIEPQQDGPLYVRGRLQITRPDGSVRETTRAALCRCGHSQNKPFCDNSHIPAGFRSE